MVEDELTTLSRIMEEGKKEFLEKGFKDASLRGIVKRANVTTGAFYFYYKDKEALFEALVAPVADTLKGMFLTMHKRFDGMSREEKIEAAFEYSPDKIRFTDFIYDHFDEFKLLISCSEGTNFSNFTHQLVDIDVAYTLKFLESVDSDVVVSGRISKELLHILSSAFFSGIFEIIVHNMPKEAADSYLSELRSFFTAGWRSILHVKASF